MNPLRNLRAAQAKREPVVRGLEAPPRLRSRFASTGCPENALTFSGAERRGANTLHSGAALWVAPFPFR